MTAPSIKLAAEGLEAWGKREKADSKKDFTYIETNNPEDNSTNIDQAIRNGFTTIISLKLLQAEELENAAKDNPKLKFALVDGEIMGKRISHQQPLKIEKILIFHRTSCILSKK